MNPNDAFLDSIVENIPDMIFVKEAQDLRFVRFNKAGEDLLGYRREELIGKNDYDFFPKNEADFFVARDRAVLDSGRLLDIPEEPIHTRFKGKRILHTKKIPLLDARGKPRYLLGISEDITDLRRSEREESELHRDRNLAAIGRLAGGVAHDFNNLIIGIAGIAQDLQAEMAPGHLRDELDEVIKAAQRATQLTRQLLAFSRQKVIQPHSLDINTVVTEYRDFLERLIGEDIRLRLDLRAHQHIKMDPGGLGQIIMNMSINARDAMTQGGVLTLRTEDTVLQAHVPERRLNARPGAYVMLQISDSGHGMTREVQERLFEPFFTTKEPGKGTGLGLATVQRIVQQAGGDIRVQSTPGVGSTFKIYFPALSESQAVVETIPSPETARSRGETVLTIEDDPLVRRILARRLMKLGYNVLEAESGSQALKLAGKESHKIDLVLTDVIMPEMNGRELVNKLKAQKPDIKVLYMSGYPQETIITRGVLEPGTEFIEKTDVVGQIAQRVRQVLDAPVGV
jgi:two-component system cell cycle sensor histidine kinase/response regulator CckA